MAFKLDVQFSNDSTSSETTLRSYKRPVLVYNINLSFNPIVSVL